MNDWDGPTSGAPATGQREPRRNPRRVGSLVGGLIGAVLVATLWMLYEVDVRWDQDAAPDEVGISVYWFVLWLAVAATAFLLAIVVATRRATSPFGVGMLFGLTVMFLVGTAVLLLQVAFTPA